MKKVEQYLKQATECRALARNATLQNRQKLEQMADNWEHLAEVRKQQLNKQFDAEKSET